jgi:ABC-type Fe3+ transport system permease subunit
MAKNQVELRRAGTWGPAWAIAGWFVPPCILYVIPYLMLRDLWKASDPNSAEDWKRNPVGPIVHIWWFLFGLLPIAFISVTVGNFRFNANSDDVDAADKLVDGFNVSVASAVVQLAAAVAFLLLVTQLSARHRQTIGEA